MSGSSCAVKIQRRGKTESYLVEADKFIVGRAPDCDFVIAEPQISRNHLGIKIQNSKVFVKDLGSANGSFIGEDRVPTEGMYECKDSDTIRLGNTQIFISVETLTRKIDEKKVADLKLGVVETQRVAEILEQAKVQARELHGQYERLVEEGRSGALKESQTIIEEARFQAQELQQEATNQANRIMSETRQAEVDLLSRAKEKEAEILETARRTAEQELKSLRTEIESNVQKEFADTRAEVQKSFSESQEKARALLQEADEKLRSAQISAEELIKKTELECQLQRNQVEDLVKTQKAHAESLVRSAEVDSSKIKAEAAALRSETEAWSKSERASAEDYAQKMRSEAVDKAKEAAQIELQRAEVKSNSIIREAELEAGNLSNQAERDAEQIRKAAQAEALAVAEAAIKKATEDGAVQALKLIEDAKFESRENRTAADAAANQLKELNAEIEAKKLSLSKFEEESRAELHRELQESRATVDREIKEKERQSELRSQEIMNQAQSRADSSIADAQKRAEDMIQRAKISAEESLRQAEVFFANKKREAEASSQKILHDVQVQVDRLYANLEAKKKEEQEKFQRETEQVRFRLDQESKATGQRLDMEYQLKVKLFEDECQIRRRQIELDSKHELEVLEDRRREVQTISKEIETHQQVLLKLNDDIKAKQSEVIQAEKKLFDAQTASEEFNLKLRGATSEVQRLEDQANSLKSQSDEYLANIATYEKRLQGEQQHIEKEISELRQKALVEFSEQRNREAAEIEQRKNLELEKISEMRQKALEEIVKNKETFRIRLTEKLGSAVVSWAREKGMELQLGDMNQSLGTMVTSAIEEQNFEASQPYQEDIGNLFVQQNGKRKATIRWVVAASIIVVGVILFWKVQHGFSLENFLAGRNAKGETPEQAYARQLRERNATKKFNPEKTASYKGSYTDNVLYTANFVEVYFDESYQSKWLKELNRMFISEFGLEDSAIVDFIAAENTLVQTLNGERESINADFQQVGIDKMRRIENEQVEKMRSIVKESAKYRKLQSFAEKFWSEAMSSRLPASK